MRQIYDKPSAVPRTMLFSLGRACLTKNAYGEVMMMETLRIYASE
jgi:hypothetical protein